MIAPTFLNRQALHLRPDPTRVVVLPFKPATEPRNLTPPDKTRAAHIVDRVLALTPEAAAVILADVLTNFDGRHRNLLSIFETRARQMEELVDYDAYSITQRQLIGAYFLHEYSFESSALFNPSVVPHPDQAGTLEGHQRFIVSLRAVGEGHVSSLTFRTGSIGPDGVVTVDPPEQLASTPTITSRVGDTVELSFKPEEHLSERVIFPITEAQVNGIEDARFVRFIDDGSDDCGAIYYATFTAYSGRAIRSELIETRDFLSFRMTPLRGSAATNKGMALFPRRINGQYAMIQRQDNENLFLTFSQDLHVWEGGTALLKPEFPWEFVQIGNCGSPVELDEGWLLLTHGVGPMRRYAIGAVLLDKDDPSRIIARSHEPLVQPDQTEREGYVPNVVYTCGAMRHRNRILLPYAVSDSFSNFATIKIATLLAAMVPV